MSGGEPGGTTVRPLIGVGSEGPAPDWAEVFPENPPGTDGEPDGTRRIRPPQPRPVDAPRGARRAAARSRRRPRTVVTVAAAVTGVGVLALVGHLVTGPGEADRALPAPSASQPHLALPSLLDSDGTANPSRSAGAASARQGAGDASPSASGPASGTGTRAPATATATTTATAQGGTTATAGSGGAVLKPGSRGDEVVALQQRLAQVRLYDGPADGKYDGGVKDAVQRYQQEHGVTGDSPGFYGPATRRSLESVTSAP
ncbi:peptidoglycan-binding protein [Streptomyces sp. NPDC058864]